MHNFNHTRCTACGELAIKPMQRFIGGWFFIRCPNCRRQLRVDPQHGPRWILLTAFVLIGAAALAGEALTGQTLSFVGAGVLACAMLYVWEFLLTRRAPARTRHGRRSARMSPPLGGRPARGAHRRRITGAAKSIDRD